MSELTVHGLRICCHTGLSALRLLEERSIFCPASRPPASVAKLAPDPAESLSIRSSSATCRSSGLLRGESAPTLQSYCILHPSMRASRPPRSLAKLAPDLAESLSIRSSSATCRRSNALRSCPKTAHEPLLVVQQASLHACIKAACCCCSSGDPSCRKPFHAQLPCSAPGWPCKAGSRSHKFSMLNSHAWALAALEQEERCQGESRGSLQVVACIVYDCSWRVARPLTLIQVMAKPVLRSYR